MNIILYKNSAPPNKVDKESKLSNQNIVENVRFFNEDSLDILNPTLLLNLSNDVSDIAQYNYVKIPKFDRYYYIVSASMVNGLFKIECKVDSLMSHKDDILSSTQYILRQESKNNSPYLDDNMLPLRSDHNYLFQPFGSNVDDRSCGRVILATTGKGGTIV